MSKCTILFSGGSDSFCSAALACESFDEVHLLTFFEKATASSPVPQENVDKLKSKYPKTKIVHKVLSTDTEVRFLSYFDYFTSLRKFHFLNLATPGLSSLSWHIQTIKYCQTEGIKSAFDGMTKELLHLPGHMPEVRQLFKDLYQEFHISFSSLVMDWEVPPDQRFMDKLIVDRHGFSLNAKPKVRTTGQWLFENQLLPHPNVKGSLFDQRMQHDCYPFVVYNMLVFWIMVPLIGFESFKIKLTKFISYKIDLAKRHVLNANA
jgi:hypothetical protein